MEAMSMGAEGLGLIACKRGILLTGFYNHGPNSKFDIDDTWFRPAFLGSGAGTGG